MNYWFLGYIALVILNLGVTLAKHGQSKSNEKYNFWSSLIGAGIGLGIIYMAITVGF